MTFVISTLGFVLFRCYTLAEVSDMGVGLFGGNGVGAWPDLGQHETVAYVGLAVGLLVTFAMPRSAQLVRRCQPLVMLLVLALFVCAVCQVLAADFVPFIYFQF